VELPGEKKRSKSGARSFDIWVFETYAET